MLSLGDWRRLPTSRVIHELLAQASDAGVYANCSAMLIQASLELLIDGRLRHDPNYPRQIRLDPDGLRLGYCVFHNCCHIDDAVINNFERLAKRRLKVRVFVPPSICVVVQRCIAGKLAKRLIVQSVNEFISYRVLFSSMDLNLGHERTIRRLLDFYGRLNFRFGHSETAIQFPSV